MKYEDRFLKIYEETGLAKGRLEVWVDRQTGVNYLYRADGHGGGLTALLNADGTPVVTPLRAGYDED